MALSPVYREIKLSGSSVPSLRVDILLFRGIGRTFKRLARRVSLRSVVPPSRYPTKEVAGDRYPADGWERHVRGHQRLAVRRQLPQKTDPNAGRLLGVVFEAVVP